ncbi:TPA: helix-turn-helix domain-containing protein [Klebsiella oxytoca]|uniref:XRE family transcriptional regulator n=1 Tax=Klebsiella michiganensis TaxID=1134687 RepID=A0A6P1USQ3_9ENTR|nr:XRE family transcriptional regulator [Klebsiella michiganensis]QHS44677.1 XRE family transcriptional regulator [Klebsiella michiganensis]HBM3110001.1 XRE family transcriptional regulator [Klebsiella oxytoca]
MMSLGTRLVEERKRLGLNQADFGALAGCARNTQANYEREERSPDSKYLSSLAVNGVDVLYVLTGKRTPDIGDISNDEIELIKLFRSAPLAVKAAALAALTAGSSATNSMTISGQGNRVAGRDYNENKK